MAATCGVCAHYEPTEDAMGTCYGPPPVPFPIPTQAGTVVLGGQPQAQGVAVMQLRCPVGKNERSCGSFERAEGSPGEL